MRILMITVVFFTASSIAHAQNSVQVGLSMGPRIIAFEKSSLLERRTASISPVDSTLKFDSHDRMEMSLAGVTVIYPFKQEPQSKAFINNLGFLAKINIADLGPEDLSVSKIIEGGIGLSYYLTEKFSVGIAIERVLGKRIQSDYQEGDKIITQDGVMLSISSDSPILVEDNFTALSFSWIFFF